MIKYKLSLIISLILLNFVLVVNSKNWINRNSSDNLKFWTPDSILSTDDFRMTPSIFGGKASASISTGIYFEKTESDVYKVRSFIDKNDSFYLKKRHKERLLKHEKYHANITYLISCLINIDLENKNVTRQHDFQKIMDGYEIVYDSIHDLYDFETVHGIDSIKQMRWENKIDSLILANTN